MESIWTGLVAILVLLTARRALMVIAALLPRREAPETTPPLPVAVLTSVHNDAPRLRALLRALERLEYPEDRIEFCFVNDASTDETAAVLDDHVRNHPAGQAIHLPSQVGKAEALNRALEHVGDTELVAVYDADMRPAPDSLLRLVGVFSSAKVGAASGFRRPSGPLSGMVSRYAALESWVHQLITQAAKDRLGLNPTTLGGNCVYRRNALTDVGGFPPGAFSEDIEVSLAISAKGWETRFVEGAVADADVATSLSRYWNQHLRWARGLYRSTRFARGLEGVAVALGYADRILFLTVTILALLGKVSLFWPLLYVAVPLLGIVLAIARARAGWWMGLRVVASLPMFFVDLAGTLVATLGGAVGLPLPWITGGEKTPPRP